MLPAALFCLFASLPALPACITAFFLLYGPLLGEASSRICLHEESGKEWRTLTIGFCWTITSGEYEYIELMCHSHHTQRQI
jgi:hypothetical protein